jgi:hypothetical protein
MSTPSADDGPDSVLTKPTLTLSAASAPAAASASSVAARTFEVERARTVSGRSLMAGRQTQTCNTYS